MTWKPGQSGNPHGRPSKKPITLALEMELKAEPKRARRIARRLLDMAEAGDLPAIKEVLDRTDGKAAQSLILDQTLIIARGELIARAVELGNRVIDGEAREIEVPMLPAEAD